MSCLSTIELWWTRPDQCNFIIVGDYSSFGKAVTTCDNWRIINWASCVVREETDKWDCSHCMCSTPGFSAHLPCLKDYHEVIDVSNIDWTKEPVCVFGCCINDWSLFLEQA